MYLSVDGILSPPTVLKKDSKYSKGISSNNISLNVGSAFLKNDTDYVIDKIKKGELSPNDLEALSETLDNVYSELRIL